MKYLKTYENLYNIEHIKKYLIYNDPINKKEYDIVEVTKKDSSYIYIKYLYNFNIKHKHLSKYITLYSSFIRKYDLKYIIYMSDNLKDCLDNINKIEDIKKYNL